MEKTLSIIGLGKMGKSIALNLHEQGWILTGFDVSKETREDIASFGIKTVDAMNDITVNENNRRVVWVMLPAGDISEKVFLGEGGLLSLLKEGDVVIDAANSFYEDSVRRGKLFNAKGIHFIDVGFSGGPSSARTGACVMVGGSAGIIEELAPLFEALSIKDGWARCGESGAGHFTKMVHNGIEYGMMQSLAEGFAVLRAAPFDLDVHKIADLYNHRSIIESRLVGWVESGYREFGVDLERVDSTVAHTGEGKWTVETAKKLRVETPSIELAYNFRVESAKKPSYTGKVLSMLRNQFGGHSAKK